MARFQFPFRENSKILRKLNIFAENREIRLICCNFYCVVKIQYLWFSHKTRIYDAATLQILCNLTHRKVSLRVQNSYFCVNFGTLEFSLAENRRICHFRSWNFTTKSKSWHLVTFANLDREILRFRPQNFHIPAQRTCNLFNKTAPRLAKTKSQQRMFIPSLH